MHNLHEFQVCFLIVCTVLIQLQQKLNEIRQGIEKIRNFDKTYVTENKIFFVDCSGIHDSLIPKLNQIVRELCTFVAEESVVLAKAFSEEMETVTAVRFLLYSSVYFVIKIFCNYNNITW